MSLMGNIENSCKYIKMSSAPLLLNRNHSEPPHSSSSSHLSPSSILAQHNIISQMEELQFKNQLLTQQIAEKDIIIKNLQYKLQHCHCQFPLISPVTVCQYIISIRSEYIVYSTTDSSSWKVIDIESIDKKKTIWDKC